MNLSKEQPPAKYTLELDYAELRELYYELLDFRGQHSSQKCWPTMTRVFDLAREHMAPEHV